jgi:osmoprotectant transport system permease protein
MSYLLDPFNYDMTDPESIPNLLIQHLTIVGVSMLISIVVAIPVGIFIARRRPMQGPVIGIAGLLYTIPGIALLAYLIPLTGLSLATIVIPLVLYAQLVLIRNTVAGVNSIDPHLLEVGRAMGMTNLQLLLRVTLPLALPMIVAGIRVATVTSIGIATLASLVGNGGLGDLIFVGIHNLNLNQVFAGGFVVALLAIVMDLFLLGVQTLLNRGRSSVALS